MKSTTARRLALVCLVAPLALTACSGGSDKASGGSSSSSSSSESLGDLKAGQAVDKAAFFKVTKEAAEKNKTYSFKTEVGEGGSVMSSAGAVDNTDPNNRKRRITLKNLSGVEVQMIIAGNKVHQRVGNTGKWEQAPLSPKVESSLGGNPQNFEQDQAIAQNISYVGEEDVEGVKSRHFSLTLDVSKASPAPSAPAAGAPAASPKLEIWLDEKNRMRKRLDGTTGVATTTVYEKWGEAVDIPVPVAEEILPAK